MKQAHSIKCWKCDDNYYNTADMNSIRDTTKCCFCDKEVRLKQELVGLRKDKKVAKLKLNSII